MKNNTSARIYPLSGFLYVTRIFAGGMDGGFDATLYSDDRDTGEFLMTIPCKSVFPDQTSSQGNIAGPTPKARIHF